MNNREALIAALGIEAIRALSRFAAYEDLSDGLKYGAPDQSLGLIADLTSARELSAMADYYLRPVVMCGCVEWLGCEHPWPTRAPL